jgi:hypothetical protein
MAKDIMQYEVGDFLLFDTKGEVVGVSGNTDFWHGDNPPKAGSEEDYIIVVVMERGKDGEITQVPDLEEEPDD